jgi:hypothetical protein
MRIVAKIAGVPPPDWLNSRSRVAAQAISIGIDAAGKGAQQDIRAMIRAAGMGHAPRQCRAAKHLSQTATLLDARRQ